MKELTIRELAETDGLTISQAFAAQGWQKPEAQYQRYWQESQVGKRTVLLAVWKGVFAGYVTIVWESDYAPFRVAHIPEITDFNVLRQYQRRRVGTVLMDEAERRIAERSPIAGIGVGLTVDYGAAQILYVKRGYVPDGRGIFQDGKHLSYGETAVVDDDLVLYFTKKVGG